ncbi:MAG: hypothetical protein WD824_20730 [Cyclobacteriaceae bacterium]
MRKGKRSTALMSLKTNSIVNPTILKGRRRSQKRGKRNSMIRAIGQQITSKKHQSTREIKTFIYSFGQTLCKSTASSSVGIRIRFEVFVNNRVS